MIAVVVSLVAVVLLVLVVVALGMRSMNRRESSLPPERLKEMAEKEEKTKTRSTDEFAKHEPRMANFSPDFSPIDAPKQKPVRTGQRGRRGVDEWGNPVNDDDDEEFWASIRSEAEEGGFGAGGTVAARKASSSSRSADRHSERTSERHSEREQRPAAQADRPARPSGRPGERPAKRSSRSARPQPATASADPDATTVQAPLPQRQPSSQRQSSSQRQPAAGLADLVEPQKRVPSKAELAEQRTVTFAAPTSDVMSILGPGAQPVPAPTPPEPPTRPAPVASSGVSSSQSATGGSYGASSTTSGSYPATPAATGSGSFPAVSPTSSGSFPAAPAAPAAPVHGAPTSDPFPAYGGTPDPLDTGYGSTSRPAASTTSGSWPASPSPDILDDPAPSSGTSYGGATSWPGFEQPAARSSYPATYEVSSGYAVADDSDPLTGPSPATGTPTVPGRAVSNYDVLSAPTPPPAQPASPFAMGAYETGDITTSPASASWPEPPAPESGRSSYSRGRRSGSHRRAAPDQDLPHDYYR